MIVATAVARFLMLLKLSQMFEICGNALINVDYFVSIIHIHIITRFLFWLWWCIISALILV